MARNVTWGQMHGGADLALETIDGLLKDDYVINNITDVVNMSTYLLSRLTSERTTAGRRFGFPLRLGVGEGQGNRRERQTLPEAGFGEYEQAFGNVVFQYGLMDISGPAIEATEGGRATFASALKQALKDVRDGFKLETYTQSWGNGSGTLANVETGANSAIQAVTTPFGLTYTNSSLENSQKVRMFRRNMKIVFMTAGAARTIVAVNGDGTIELDSAVNTTTGERIVRGDSSTLNNDAKALLGVNGAVLATGTYLGIPRAGEPGWQSNLIDLAGEPLDEDIIQHAFDTAEINGDGTSSPSLLISEHRVRRLYVGLLQTQRRFMNPMTLTGGFKALEYNGVPWVVDKLCPPQRIYYLNPSDFKWFVMKDIGWLQRDGTILKWVHGQDAYQAVLAAYRQLVCTQPANQTVLFDVTRILTPESL